MEPQISKFYIRFDMTPFTGILMKQQLGGLDMKSRIFGTEIDESKEVNLPGPDESVIPPVPGDRIPSADSTGSPIIPEQSVPAADEGSSIVKSFVSNWETGGNESVSIPAGGGSSGGSGGGGIRGGGSVVGSAFRRFLQASIQLGSKRIPVWALTIILLLIVIIVIIVAGSSSSGGGKGAASKYKEQFELVEKFEIAYNKHDYYAMFECFDPAVMQFYSGLLGIGMSLGGANISSSDLQAVLPGLSQMFGASGFLDEAAGQVDFQPFNFVGNEAGGIVVYHVKLKKPSGNEEFDQAAELIKVDGKWYFSSTQRDQNTLMKMVEENKYEAGTSYGGILYSPGGGGW